MHSKLFEIAKENYDEGYWNKAMLRTLVKIGKLNSTEYKEITGEDY